VPITTISAAIGHNMTLPVFSAVISAAAALETPPKNIGQKFWHMESTSAA
jgi:hypothetical protein